MLSELTLTLAKKFNEMAPSEDESGEGQESAA